MTLEIKWVGAGRFAQNPPNPLYPEGVDVDMSKGADRTCECDLPYPAPECGIWLVSCLTCKLVTATTAAGRIDDPRHVKVACRRGQGGAAND